MVFASVETALAMVNPNPDYAVIIDALKNFKASAAGADRCHGMVRTAHAPGGICGMEYGIPQKDGSVRYTNLTNGGPIHIDVRDGRIIRTMPIEFDAADPPSWTIRARAAPFRRAARPPSVRTHWR